MSKASDLAKEVNAALGEEVVRLGNHPDLRVTYIPTGLLPVDILLQGGLPRGRFVLANGDYSTLKTYVGLCAIKQVQDEGGTAALIDTEHAYDPSWAEQIGINTEDLLMPPTPTGEKAIDTAEALVRGGVDLIVFDSVAAALPQAEAEKRLHKENIQPARLAALMSAACRRLTAANDKTAIFWINQTRVNLGVTFGSKDAMPGGKALPYYASIILNIRKAGKITRDVKFYDGEKWVGGKEQIGQTFKATTEKSKLNKPFREVWFDWNLTSSQIDLPKFLVAQGLELGLVKQSGNTWTFKSWKAVGRQKFIDLVVGSPKALAALSGAVEAAHGVSTPVVTSPATKKRVIRRSK